MPSLTRVEAAARAAALTVESYDIQLDVTGGPERFGSRTVVRFRVTGSGAATFLELRPAVLESVTLDGRELDPASLAENRLLLPGLTAGVGHEVVVRAQMAYGHVGEGLHRYVDPVDGETYLYAHSFMDNAQAIFACFDQPDLKAPVALTVTAPAGWLVAANAPAAGPEEGEAGRPGAVRWRFRPTEPLSTYLITLLAGPYHVRRDTHDGIPLALYTRRSLASHLDKDVEEIFGGTKSCLDTFHALFGMRYPFGKYDQAFVPDFNGGAMENPGLVTFRDDFVFESAVTDSERELRTTVIAHEMAHMWFGDLVTMRWWDDLWLNESFAEFLGSHVTAEATRFTNAWTTFAIKRKGWGYAADQRPSTHPVAPTDVADTTQALLNFDGISYAKGASVLRQLVAWLGEESFFTGLRAYFAAYRFGNATLDDLLRHLSAAAGRDLSAWAEVWLRRAQVNTLAAEVALDEGGRYASVAVRQSAPAAHPTLRPHRLGLGLYDLTDGRAVLRRRVAAEVGPVALSPVPELTGEPAADLLLPNDGDLAYAKIRLDPASAAAVPAVLPALADPLARAVLWASVLDATRDAERPVTELVELVGRALPHETEVVVIEDVLGLVGGLVDRYLPPTGRRAALDRVAQGCRDLLAAAEPGTSRQLAAARALIDASADGTLPVGWLTGGSVPAGLSVDVDLRWRIRYRQSVLGRLDVAGIDEELTVAPGATAEQWAARCRAAVAEPAAKAAAWRTLMTDTALSGRLLEEVALGFWQAEQAELTAPYVPRYFAEMPAASARRPPWVAERVARLAFPHVAVAPATREAAARLLAQPDLSPGLRRAVTDADDELGRALAARARF